MNEGRTFFSQLISFLPDREFRLCVERYGDKTPVRESNILAWDNLDGPDSGTSRKSVRSGGNGADGFNKPPASSLPHWSRPLEMRYRARNWRKWPHENHARAHVTIGRHRKQDRRDAYDPVCRLQRRGRHPAGFSRPSSGDEKTVIQTEFCTKTLHSSYTAKMRRFKPR